MFNLPGQTMTEYLGDLKRAIKLKLDSITCYPLGLPVHSIIHFSREERMHRVFVKGLSVVGRVDKRKFLEEFGENPGDYFSNIIDRLKERKSLYVNDKEISLSYLGKFLCADVCSSFL